MQRFFSPEEFKCHCGRINCDAAPMDMETVLKLEGLRLEFNQPMHVDCGVRCAYQNAAVGGEADSQHLYGRAVDIGCLDGYYMRRLVALALKHGFSFGLKKHMIHLDTRPTQPVAFGYDQ